MSEDNKSENDLKKILWRYLDTSGSINWNYVRNGMMREQTLVFLAGILEKKESETLLKILFEEFPLDADNIFHVYQCARESGLKREESEIMDKIMTFYEKLGERLRKSVEEDKILYEIVMKWSANDV